MTSSTPSQLFEFGYSDAMQEKQPQSNAMEYLKGYAAGAVAADKVMRDRLDRIQQIKALLQERLDAA